MSRSALALAVLLAACGEDAPDESAPAPEAPASEASEANAPAQTRPEPEPEPVVPAARPTDAAAFDGHHILVRNGSTLRMGTGPDAPELKLSLEPADADPTPALAMRVVGHEDGRLLVRAPASAERCGDGLKISETFDLTFSVAPSSAARVLARPFEAKFRDGTRVTLRPGVAVGDEGDAVTVDARGIHLSLPIPETEIGTVYDPDPNEAPAKQQQTLGLGKRLHVDGNPVSPQSALYGSSHGRPDVLATSEVGDATFTRVGNRCATFEAKTSDADDATEEEKIVKMARSVGVIGVLGGSGLEDQFTVEAGAKIYWPDGTEAGEVLASHTFDNDQVEKGRKGKRCFSEALDPSLSGGAVTLCFRRKDVTKQESPYASLLGTSMIGSSGFGSASTLGTLGSPREEDIWGEGTIGLGSTGLKSGGVGGSGSIGTIGTIGKSKPSGEISLSTSVTGELSKDGVAKIAKRAKHQLRYCYERELAKDDTLEGTVKVSATIGPSGKVSAATSSGPKTVASCMEKTVERMMFPSASSITIAKLTVELSKK